MILTLNAFGQSGLELISIRCKIWDTWSCWKHVIFAMNNVFSLKSTNQGDGGPLTLYIHTHSSSFFYRHPLQPGLFIWKCSFLLSSHTLRTHNVVCGSLSSLTKPLIFTEHPLWNKTHVFPSSTWTGHLLKWKWVANPSF